MAAQKKSGPSKERKTRVSTVPTDETKRAKFIRLATQRCTKATKAISGIGNLSGSAYDFSEGDVAKIKSVLGEATNSMLARFQPKVTSSAPVVKFED